MTMNSKYIIYSHRNKVNNKSYIGQTKNIKDRWIPSHYKGCRLFYNAIQKYGWDNFEHIILKDNISTIEEANYWEKFYILLFDTMNLEVGYNLASGGNNKILSEETKRLIKEHHADFSKENHPMWRKHHSEETKEKIRQGHIGKKQPKTQEQKEKMKLGGNPNAKKVKCIDTGEIFSCAKEASLKYNVDNSTLSKCAKGKIKSCAGLRWEYI